MYALAAGYGLTETSPTIAVTDYAPTTHLQGAMRAFPGVTLKIRERGVPWSGGVPWKKEWVSIRDNFYASTRVMGRLYPIHKKAPIRGHKKDGLRPGA